MRPGAALHDQGSQPAPPIKPATWEWYIPIYFWLGGIAGGGWLVATAEDLTGERNRPVIRAGRYLALGGVLAGTGLLIADLGRPDRFLNMLRIVRLRSTMSLGSWGLTMFGACAGLGALLQAGEDGLLGRRSRLVRLSRGRLARALHLIGLPPALFVAGYTGVLLASTSTPSWALRTRLLGPLFLASAASSGLAAVSLALELGGRRRPRIARRLARAESIGLAAELALAAASRGVAGRLPSARVEPAADRGARALTAGAGIAAPLALAAAHAGGRRRRVSRRKHLAASGLALAGSLALRYLVVREGRRSARYNADTWRLTEMRAEMREQAG